jgi:phenylacetate-CoA ligase
MAPPPPAPAPALEPVLLTAPTCPTPDPEHESRALAAIVRARRDIPFYVKRASPAPDERGQLRDALSRFPLLFKNDLRATLPRQWVPTGRDVKAALASGEIELIETSGSTGERTRVLWDKGWWLRQEERGMRTNALVARAMDGEKGDYREAVLTTPVCGLGTCHTGDSSYEERVDGRWVFINQRPDPAFWKPEDMTRMLDEIARHETVGLESDPTYLATLARHATREGREIAVTGFVTLTYAMTSAAHLRPIRRALRAPALQLYGSTEVGVLFMEGEDGRLHHCPFTTHVELIFTQAPTPGAKDVALVVVTTMDRVAQPLLRFVVGDLVQVDRSCPSRFTTVPPLTSMEGRLQDALLRPDGALVTAAAVDRALAPLEGVAGYQMNQRTPEEADIDVVPEPGASASLLDDVRGRLQQLLAGLELEVRQATAIASEPSGKYRLARRHFPIDLGRVFAECEGISL